VGDHLQLLAETYPAGSVTLAAEQFLQNTTSAGAAGLWEPYKLGACPFRISSSISLIRNNLPAQLLAEAYPAGCITVAAESFGENTTSAGAGGLWKPFLAGTHAIDLHEYVMSSARSLRSSSGGGSSGTEGASRVINAPMTQHQHCVSGKAGSTSSYADDCMAPAAHRLVRACEAHQEWESTVALRTLA
jgi:hypothetical protein